MTLKELKIIIIALLLFILFCGTSYSAENYYSDLKLNCQSAVLMDYDTGKILFEKNSDELISPASLTKLMTVYLVMEKVRNGELSLDDVYIVTKNADFRSSPPHSSLMFLEAGQKVTVRDILSGLSVSSGNDCAVAAAEIVSGNVEDFVALMNRRAKEMGFESFYFVEPSGFDHRNLINAMDFCRFCRMFISDCSEIFPFTVSLESFTYPKVKNLNGTKAAYGGIKQYNTNDALSILPDTCGLKSGHIDEVGYNVAICADNGDMKLIAVILGNKGKDNITGRLMRMSDSASLMTYGFSAFRTFSPVLSDDIMISVPGASSKARVIISETDKITVCYGEIGNIMVKITPDKKLSAPLKAGSYAGNCTFYLGDTVLGMWNLTVADDIPKMNFMQKFVSFFTSVFRKDRNKELIFKYQM